jgi:hypothetical protein
MSCQDWGSFCSHFSSGIFCSAIRPAWGLIARGRRAQGVRHLPHRGGWIKSEVAKYYANLWKNGYAE